jgi:hypothetical protein
MASSTATPIPELTDNYFATAKAASIGDSGCVLAQRPGMDVMASSLGEPWAGRFQGVVRARGGHRGCFRVGESGSAWARAQGCARRDASAGAGKGRWAQGSSYVGV